MRIPGIDNLVDRKLAAALTEYANTANTKEVPRKPPAGELTFSRLMQFNASQVKQRIGVYNPETITFQTLDKMSKHHQIGFGTAFIQMPLETVDWWIDCEDDDINSFLQQALGDVWRRLVKSAMKAVTFGCAPHEIVWAEQQAYRVWNEDLKVDNTMPLAYVFDRIKAVDPQYTTLKLEADRFAGFEQMGGGDVPKEKGFWFTHDEIFGNLYGRSRYIHSYDPWYWSAIVVAFANRYLERSGSPTPKGTAPEGFTNVGTEDNPDDKNNLDLIQEIAEAVREGAAVSLPSSTAEEAGWDLEYLTDDNRGAAFVPMLEKYDSWMLRGLFIPERALTQDTEVGSNAMASTHADMFIMSEESLISDMADAVSDMIIPSLLLYNFGAKAPRARVKVKGFTDERKGLIKEIFVGMIQSGQAQPAAEELARELDIPMADGAGEQDTTAPTPGGEPPADKQPADQPTEQQVRDAAATLSEAHAEVKQLLSERKLADACAC